MRGMWTPYNTPLWKCAQGCPGNSKYRWNTCTYVAHIYTICLKKWAIGLLVLWESCETLMIPFCARSCRAGYKIVYTGGIHSSIHPTCTETAEHSVDVTTAMAVTIYAFCSFIRHSMFHMLNRPNVLQNLQSIEIFSIGSFKLSCMFNQLVHFWHF